MDPTEFNEKIKETPDAATNEQPKEFVDVLEAPKIEEHGETVAPSKKKSSTTSKAASFLFLIAGASTTVAGVDIIKINKDKVQISVEEVTANTVSFSFVTNVEGLSCRVYNDFETRTCDVVYLDKDDDGNFYGIGECGSLRENTEYTVSLDGSTVLGNASKGKKRFSTSKKSDEPVIHEKELESISISGVPTKSVYYENEIFDPQGITVSASYTTGEVEDVSEYAIWDQTPLTLNDTSVSVSYTFNNITKTAKYTGISVISEMIHVERIYIPNQQVSLKLGETDTILYEILPEDATDKSVTFSSSNEDCIIVDNYGIAHAVGVGEAIITITTNDGGLEGSIIYQVTKDPTWQDDVTVNTTYENLDDDIIDYTIDCKNEIENISQFIFRYYTLDDELILEKYEQFQTPQTTTAVNIPVNIAGINEDIFYVVIGVIRNGEEELLGYSEQYNLREIYTHPDDIEVNVDNSLTDSNDTFYFSLDLNDPYDYYSDLRASLTDASGYYLDAIIDRGSKTNGYFNLLSGQGFSKSQYATLNVYIKFSGNEEHVYSEEVNLYSSIYIERLKESVECEIDPQMLRAMINVNTTFYDYMDDYGDYLIELCDEAGNVAHTQTYQNSATSMMFDYQNAILEPGHQWDIKISIFYKEEKTLLKIIDNVISD